MIFLAFKNGFFSTWTSFLWELVTFMNFAGGLMLLTVEDLTGNLETCDFEGYRVFGLVCGIDTFDCTDYCFFAIIFDFCVVSLLSGAVAAFSVWALVSKARSFRSSLF